MIRMLAAAGAFALIATGGMAQQPGMPAQLVPATQPVTAARSQPLASTITEASLSWAEARSRIEARGFADVRGLTRDGMGGWRGKALKEGRLINVSVAPTGEVTAR